jgi:ribosome-binding protein aMBF1 (putative translation factor)
VNSNSDPRSRSDDSSTDFRDDLSQRLTDPELAAEFREAHERAALGLKIARLRTARGLSQAQLATRLNTTQSVISRYESADYRSYNIETLRRLASALGGELIVDLRDTTPPRR